MKGRLDTRAIRALVSGILSSELSEPELREFAQELVVNDELRLRVAFAIHGALLSIDGHPTHFEPTERIQRFPRERWTASLRRRLTDRVLATGSAHGLSASELYASIAKLAPVPWKPRPRHSVASNIDELWDSMSPEDAQVLVELFSAGTPHPDAFLRGILDKEKKTR